MSRLDISKVCMIGQNNLNPEEMSDGPKPSARNQIRQVLTKRQGVMVKTQNLYDQGINSSFGSE